MQRAEQPGPDFSGMLCACIKAINPVQDDLIDGVLVYGLDSVFCFVIDSVNEVLQPAFSQRAPRHQFPELHLTPD